MLKMSLQTTEEKILSILADTEKWREEDFKINLKDCWPFITEFVSVTNEPQVVTQVIVVSFRSFLPHLSLDLESDALVNIFLAALLNNLTNLLDEIKAEGSGSIEDNLECVVLCMESSKILLNYFLHEGVEEEKISFNHVHKVPNSAVKIINLSIKHYIERAKYYDTNIPKLETFLQSLVKEITDGSSLLCDLISKIDWISDCSEGLNSLSDVCENLSEIAHCFSIISELKTSVIAWKTYVSLIQLFSEELKREIVLSSTVDFLFEEIQEGLSMMKSFEKNDCQRLEPNEERIFDRILKRSVFNLRILVIICNKFCGFLRGTHSKFLRIILCLFRYSSHSLLLENLPSDCRKKIEEQLSVGIYPLLLHLQKEEDFIQELSTWLENNKTITKEDFLSSSDHVSFLLLLISLVKQELADPFKESKINIELILLRNIIQILPFCHLELSCPQMLPGLMHDGQAQEQSSLYSYTLIHTCALVSVFDERLFAHAESILFQNVLSTNQWNILFSSDVLCFLARYGSAALCEEHCFILIKVLKENDLMNEECRSQCLILLARLLSFAKPSTMENILSHWISENPPKKLVGELFCYLKITNIEEIQSMADKYIFVDAQNNKFLPETLSEESMEHIFAYLESAAMYCRSSSIQIDKINTSFTSYLIDILTYIFERFPEECIHYSLVSKMLVYGLQLSSQFIKFISKEVIYKIYEICNRAIKKGNESVILSIAKFMSSSGLCEVSNRMKDVLNQIEGIFVGLLIQSNEFIRMKCIQSLVSFAQFTKHEQIFSYVVSQLPNDISEEITHYLQFVPQKLSNTQKSVLQKQTSVLLSTKVNLRKECYISINISSDIILEENKQTCEVKESSDDRTERLSKRKRLDEGNACDDVIDKLEFVKNTLISNDYKKDYKLRVKNKLNEILALL